jgi:hypothetical protein
VLEAPIQDSSPETGGYGLLGRSIPVVARDRLGRPVFARAGEAACRVAVARGDVPGVQLGADPADRSMSERGKRPGGARRTRSLGFGAGAPSAVAVGAWRRTRSSRGSHDPPGRAGKPSTGRRGPVSTQQTGRKEVVGEHRRAAPERVLHNQRSLHERVSDTTPLYVLMESRMRWKSQVRLYVPRGPVVCPASGYVEEPLGEPGFPC